MTQEEKQLLLKDLCCRLPYGIIVHHDDYLDKDYPRPNEVLTTHKLSQYEEEFERWNLKPYLRPMSSMTEEEREEYYSIDSRIQLDINGIEDGINLPNMEESDWLNAHHFDYRGLIPMGLALEAPEDMYK